MIALRARRTRAGEDGLGALRRLLEPAEAAGRIRRALPCFARGDYSLEGASAERLDVDDEGVTLSLAARVVDARTRRRSTRRVFVRSTDVTGAGVTSPLAGVDERRGLAFWMSPADPHLPRLETVLGRSALRGLLARAGVDVDPDVSIRAEVLAHRFGKRAAVRLTAEGGRPSWLLKVVARGDGARTAAALAALAGRPGAPRVPKLIHRDRAILLLEWVAGTSLHSRADGEPVTALERVGRAVRGVGVAPPPELGAHRAADEAGVARRLARRAAVVEPALGETIEAAVEACEEQARSLAPAPLVLAHRDLHDKQVILSRGRPALIDWDLAAAAPPELDAGNFIAHLRLRSLQGHLAPDRAVAWRRRFLAGWAGPQVDDRFDALRIWEGLALVRLAAVYALRPSWPGLSAGLLAAVDSRRFDS